MECKHQFVLSLHIISHSLTHYNLMNCGIWYPPSVKLFNLLKMLPAHLCHPGNILLLLSEHLDSCTNKSDEFWELFVQSLCFCRIFESSWVSRFYEPNLLAGFRRRKLSYYHSLLEFPRSHRLRTRLQVLRSSLWELGELKNSSQSIW